MNKRNYLANVIYYIFLTEQRVLNFTHGDELYTDQMIQKTLCAEGSASFQNILSIKLK